MSFYCTVLFPGIGTVNTDCYDARISWMISSPDLFPPQRSGGLQLPGLGVVQQLVLNGLGPDTIEQNFLSLPGLGRIGDSRVYHSTEFDLV
jgi:hypothetical protein